MNKVATRTVIADAAFVVLFAFFCLEMFIGSYLLNEFILAMGEFALISIVALSIFNPVLTHFSLILGFFGNHISGSS